MVTPDPQAHPSPTPTASSTPDASNFIAPGSSHEKLDQDLLHPLKPLPAELLRMAPPVTERSWFWIFQALPLALLLSFLGLRKLRRALQRLNAQHRHSRASTRYARAARNLPKDQFEYLKEKTGQNLASLSLLQLQQRLCSLGVSPALAAQTLEQLELLESMRYAPPGGGATQAQAGQIAAETIERLEREIR